MYAGQFSTLFGHISSANEHCDVAAGRAGVRSVSHTHTHTPGPRGICGYISKLGASIILKFGLPTQLKLLSRGPTRQSYVRRGILNASPGIFHADGIFHPENGRSESHSRGNSPSAWNIPGECASPVSERTISVRLAYAYSLHGL